MGLGYKLNQFDLRNIYMIADLPTKRNKNIQALYLQNGGEAAGIDMKLNYFTVTLCVSNVDLGCMYM